jgi:hypothetical protein
MSSPANLQKLGSDAIALAESLIATAATPSSAVPVMLAELTTLRDALAQLILLVPPIAAPALDPVDRATIDNEVDAEVTKP